MFDRRGIGLGEVLVAVTLLTGGLLALVASAAAGARLIAVGQQSTRLAAAAEVAVSEFQAGDCATAVGGERTIPPFVLRWSVATDGPIRALSLEVTVPDGPRRRIVRFVSARWCGAA